MFTAFLTACFRGQPEVKVSVQSTFVRQPGATALTAADAHAQTLLEGLFPDGTSLILDATSPDPSLSSARGPRPLAKKDVAEKVPQDDFEQPAKPHSAVAEVLPPPGELSAAEAAARKQEEALHRAETFRFLSEEVRTSRAALLQSMKVHHVNLSQVDRSQPVLKAYRTAGALLDYLEGKLTLAQVRAQIARVNPGKPLPELKNERDLGLAIKSLADDIEGQLARARLAMKRGTLRQPSGQDGDPLLSGEIESMLTRFRMTAVEFLPDDYKPPSVVHPVAPAIAPPDHPPSPPVVAPIAAPRALDLHSPTLEIALSPPLVAAGAPSIPAEPPASEVSAPVPSTFTECLMPEPELPTVSLEPVPAANLPTPPKNPLQRLKSLFGKPKIRNP